MRIQPAEFRDLVSGRQRGLRATLSRLALHVAEVPYTLAVGFRNWQFNSGVKSITRVAVPVISVGNLTVGGTGKTPLVEWLARWLRQHDLRVSLISRGYGAEAGAVNDEALELEQRLPDVPHLLNPDRVAAAQVAIEELETQIILLDDAFQHRRLARDLDVVLVDALEPFGFEHLLPRGTLREPLAGFARADVVVLTRADVLDTAQRQAIRERITRYRPDVVWVEAAHAPQNLLASTGAQAPINSLAGQRVAAFCGIGNPDGFQHTLKSCGYEVVARRDFPDHHIYTRDDIEQLIAWSQALNVTAVLCTCKDLVKLAIPRLGRLPLWAVSIGMEMLAGQAELETRLLALAKLADAAES
ncbi:MAG TPA: tetraacyldisaccharide 4'-kinase [Pirellulaceae bacterium]|nr:tetraacyldisaccharide 4'-kinase [Pirellulaceae bacterium]